MKMKSFGMWLILVLVFTFSFSIFFHKNPVFSEKTEPEEDIITPEDRYAIFAVDIPTKLDFAGEPVPLDQQDIWESLDREILVNTYWQSQTLLYIKRANRYFPAIEKILKKNNIPDDFKYLAVAESGLMNVVSPSQAAGFWQLLEGTAKDYGLETNDEVDERYHLEKATEAACKFLQDSYDKYGEWTLAAASYNAGRRGIDRQLKRQNESDYYDLLLNEETARYVYRILAYKLILSNPANYGFYLGEKDMYPPIPFYEVTVDGKVNDFAEFANRYNINYKILKWMNPWLRDTVLSNQNNDTYYLKIPRDGFFDPSRVNNEMSGE
jgi:peptidoglycan lytic transglycosylase D